MKAKAGSLKVAAKVQGKVKAPVVAVKSTAKSVDKVKSGASVTANAKASVKKAPARAVKVVVRKPAPTPPKSAAKPVAKATLKVAAKTIAKAPPKSTVKTAAKLGKPAAKFPVLKKSGGGSPSKAPQGKPVKAVANAIVKTKNQKPASKVVSQKVNEVVNKSSQPAVKPGLKPKAVAQVGVSKSVPPKQSAVAGKATVTAVPVAGTLSAAPVALTPKAGRPSSRLAQLTVPSMAQSVASTAAKSSYSQTVALPLIVPSLTQSAKKDPKLANNWKTKPVEQLTDPELLAMPDAEYMNDKQMAVFRLKLAVLKQDILNSAGETTEHLREDTVVVPDPADRATIEEEHALELRTRDRERKLLKKIEQSINRIDAGDYGYCDETGEPIGVGRLLARPTATLSLEAQQRRELKQKMFGD